MDSRMNTLPVNSRGTKRRGVTVIAPERLYPEPPAWLAAWTPAEPPPESAAKIEAHLTSFETTMACSTSEDVSGVLALAIDLYGPPSGWDENQAGLYLALLRDIPPDLLRYGMWVAIRDECDWFPRPAQIRAPIREELSRRRQDYKRLEMALSLARILEQRQQRRAS